MLIRVVDILVLMVKYVLRYKIIFVKILINWNKYVWLII